MARILKRLSPSMEALELECDSAESWLLNGAPPAFAWAFDEDISEQSHNNAIEEDSAHIWRLADFYPKLNTLVLKTSSHALTDDDIAHLPRTLTKLILSGSCNISPHAWKFLPPGLLSLDATSLSRIPPHCSLPANLVHFYTALEFLDSDTAKRLPETLEELNLNNCPDNFSSLPRSLRVLSISRVFDYRANNDYDWAALPPLTTFHVRLSFQDLITKKFLLSLPRTLKNLKLYGHLDFRDLDISQGETFPPSLTKLDLGHLTLDESTLRALPNTLEKLNIKTVSSVKFNGWSSWLPRNLRSLNVYGFESSSTLIDWPPYLSSVTMSNQTHFSVSPDDLASLSFPTKRTLSEASNAAQELGHSLNTGLIPQFAPLFVLRLEVPIWFTREMIENLPRSLTDLDLNQCSTIQSSFFAVMPPYLKVLRIGSMEHAIKDPEHLAQLPPTLKILDVTSMPFWYPEAKTIEILRALPRGLKELSSGTAFKSGLDPAVVFPHLPPKLRQLTITGFPLKPMHAIHLPRQLTSVKLSFQYQGSGDPDEQVLQTLIQALPSNLEPDQCHFGTQSEAAIRTGLRTRCALRERR
jgi:hypothetical protein